MKTHTHSQNQYARVGKVVPRPIYNPKHNAASVSVTSLTSSIKNELRTS